jgi:hypothetical protein
VISTLTDALVELKRYGLVGAVQGGWLMAGTAMSEPHQGIRVYENAFAIEGQDGDWVLRTDGPGQTVNEARFAALDEAIISALGWVAALPKHT